MVISLDNFSDEEIKMIEDLRLSKNMEYSQIDDKDWV
jgi:hypothetical protein